MVFPKTSQLINYRHLPIKVLPTCSAIWTIFLFVKILEQFVIVRKLSCMIFRDFYPKKLNQRSDSNQYRDN